MCGQHCVAKTTSHDAASERQWYTPGQVNPVEFTGQNSVTRDTQRLVDAHYGTKRVDYSRTEWSEGDRTCTICKEDKINEPPHYQLLPEKGVEVIDVIEAAVVSNGIPLSQASHYANTLKYLLRCGRKGSYLEDLKKARFYLDRMIVNQEKNHASI